MKLNPAQPNRFKRRPTAPLPPETPSEVVATMRGIAAGGAAVGTVTGPEDSSLSGMTAFIPFAAPGESVRARVRKLASRHLEADLLAVETPSPDRVLPRCPHFGVCGGCDLQHMNYAAQLAAKRAMVTGALRSGGLGDTVVDLVEKTVPSPPYEYRQRISLHIDRFGRCGYHKRRSHSLLLPKTCPISYTAIDEWLGRGFSLEGMIEGMEADLAVEAAENGVFGVLRLPAGMRADRVAPVVAKMAQFFAGGSVQFGEYTLGRFGIEEMIRRVGNVEVRAAPGVFSQVNPAVNAALVARILQAARDCGAKTAYDLYAGAGNFALTLAAAEGIRVFAVESDPVLVTVGKSEASRAGLNEKIIFVENDMEKFFRRTPETVDFVVADPPRAGLGHLAGRFEFSRDLVLISCELPSAVRDLKSLIEIGWEVKSIVPFDMFAQTAYVELLTVLRRPR